MPLVATEAIVLHSFDYLESSRILRLATREAGVQSVLAKGARRSRSRFGSALDLFAGGTAQVSLRPGRDLQTLVSFEVTRARSGIAADLGRFTGAAAIAELAIRFVDDDAQPALFDSLRDTFDAIAAAEPGAAREVTLGAAWRLVAGLGFAPVLDVCGDCHAALAPEATVMFSHPAGGALCAACGRMASRGRLIPPAARSALRDWLAGASPALAGPDEARAHQRLLREFLREHLADARAFVALDVWERDEWSGA
ncbi:MAG TPA: DNA repair protein RecO [Gemmatimonadaceae bacterium]|nr:DNA repair protein RecO [Gemmatimonadaceae bacterium]